MNTAAGCQTDRSLPSSSEVNNAWSCTSIPPYIFMVCFLIKRRYFFMACYMVKHRANFIFTIVKYS